MNPLTRLPEAELQVMRAIWSLPAPAETGTIRARLEEARPWNLSALQTLLSRLVDRGFLSTAKEGRQRSYTPLVAEGAYLAFENRPYLSGRGVTGLVAALYENDGLTPADLADLRAWLEETTGK